MGDFIPQPRNAVERFLVYAMTCGAFFFFDR